MLITPFSRPKQPALPAMPIPTLFFTEKYKWLMEKLKLGAEKRNVGAAGADLFRGKHKIVYGKHKIERPRRR